MLCVRLTEEEQADLDPSDYLTVKQRDMQQYVHLLR